MNIPADGDPKKFQSKRAKEMEPSPALSQANTVNGDISTRKIAIIMADGFDESAFNAMKKAITAAGAVPAVIAPHGGTITGASKTETPVDFSILTCASVLFDAVCVIGGDKAIAALKKSAAAQHFIEEAFKHCKAVAAVGDGVELLAASQLGQKQIANFDSDGKKITDDDGLVFGASVAPSKIAEAFIKAIGQHRHWAREANDVISA